MKYREGFAQQDTIATAMCATREHIQSLQNYTKFRQLPSPYFSRTNRPLNILSAPKVALQDIKDV